MPGPDVTLGPDRTSASPQDAHRLVPSPTLVYVGVATGVGAGIGIGAGTGMGVVAFGQTACILAPGPFVEERRRLADDFGTVSVHVLSELGSKKGELAHDLR